MTEVYCEIPERYTSPEERDLILKETKSIAIAGLSPKEKRDSNMVARYLMKHGYQVIPINPGQREILGERCYRSLEDIPFSVDMVDIFLNPTRIPQVVDQAIAKGVKCVWMQLGIVHNESAQRARDEGIRVVMDRCIKIEHERIQRHQQIF
jgi:predicted CoA-binding protein